MIHPLGKLQLVSESNHMSCDKKSSRSLEARGSGGHTQCAHDARVGASAYNVFPAAFTLALGQLLLSSSPIWNKNIFTLCLSLHCALNITRC